MARRFFEQFDGGSRAWQAPEPESKVPLDEVGRKVTFEESENREQEAEFLSKPVEIWVTETGFSYPRVKSLDVLEERERERMKGIEEARRRYNESLSGDRNERPMVARNFSAKELQIELDRVLEGEACFFSSPDIIMVYGGEEVNLAEEDEALVRAYADHESELIGCIDQAVRRQSLERPGKDFQKDPVVDGRIDEDIERMFSGAYQETFRTKREIDQGFLADAIFSRLFSDDESETYHLLKRSVYEYLHSSDAELLRFVLGDEALREAYEEACAFDEERAREDYQAIGFLEQEGLWRSGFVNESEYLAYRQRIAQAVSNLPLDTFKETMRERFFDRLKKGVDNFSEAFWWQEDMAEWDYRALRPVIVSVSNNPVYQRYAAEKGANLFVAGVPNTKDVERLIRLADKMKNSPASLSRDRTRRKKTEFYKDVIEEIEARSKLTADIARESDILRTIFKHREVKNILDVGCGFGRLSVPLAEQGYVVTGLDGNRVFLERARAKAEEAGVNIQFLRGDTIDYAETVEHESFDSVMYTWHSFLEAYGMGNTMETLKSAWLVLRPGGALVFDQPSRENPGMENGYYGDSTHEDYGAAYLMDEEELRFVLRMAGFEDVHILKWKTSPNELYPEGMKKWTIVAIKLDT